MSSKRIVLPLSVIISFIFIISGVLFLPDFSIFRSKITCSDFSWKQENCGYVIQKDLKSNKPVHEIIGKIQKKDKEENGYNFTFVTKNSYGKEIEEKIYFPDSSLPFGIINTNSPLAKNKKAKFTDAKTFPQDQGFEMLPVGKEVILNILIPDTVTISKLNSKFPNSIYVKCLVETHPVYVEYMKNSTWFNKLSYKYKKLSSQCTGPVVVGVTLLSK